MKIKTVKCNTILTKSKLPEAGYCINPYTGCAHGCHYCYARFMRRFSNHLDDKWGEFVDVKINASEVLAKELSKNPKKEVAIIGSVTDAYQPIEKKYKITRQCLEVLLKHDFPISVLTKSDLVLRDVDLLKRFSNCEVGLTITSLDNRVSRVFEPRASLPSQRIKALEELQNAGISTYVFIGPILPRLTNIDDILSAAEGKVNFVMSESLNSRCGNWNELLDVIGKEYPQLLLLYQNKFGKEYWDKIEKEVKELCKKHNISLKGFYRH